MKVLIQHNFTSGLGDFLNCVYEYFTTCNKLKKIGYSDFNLRLFLNKNVYLYKEQFWEVFNKSTFEKLFNNIEIIDEPITDKFFDVYVCVGTVNTPKPGCHLWDLFLENGYNENDIYSYTLYSYKKPEHEYLDIFNPNVVEKYNKLKKELNLNNYVSIYYRTHDLQDNIDTYSNYNDIFNEIIKNNDKIYVSSNSYLFKQYMKKYGDKIIMYDIPGENEAGNHYNYNKQFFNNKNLIKIRTEYVIIEMLTLSDSKEINFFTLWGRTSNFLLLSIVKDTQIKYLTL